MKRLLFILAAFAGICSALAFVRSEVSTEAVASRIAGVLVPFGKARHIDGEVSVRLFPRLAVVFRHVRIAAADDSGSAAPAAEPDLTADSIAADIDVLPLLIGQTSVDRLVLEAPRLIIPATFDLQGIVPDRALLARMLPASIVFRHGEIVLTSPRTAHRETITGIEATLRWPRQLGNLSLDGKAEWRGESFALSLQGIAPPRLASGEAGDLDLTLETASERLSFAGRSVLSDRLQLDGVVSARVEDPEHLADFIRGGNFVGRAAGHADKESLPPVEIGGHLKSLGWSASVSEAEIKIGSATADGLISARLDLPRPQLRGTLAIGDADLGSALTSLGTPRWLDWAPDPATAEGLDIDLRLSIGRALLGATQLDNVAASLLVADGQVHADIGEASLLGGAGSLSVRGVISPEGLKADGRFGLAGVAAGQLRTALSLTGLPSATGAVTVDGDFVTSGGTLAAARANLSGHARIEAGELAIAGDAMPAASAAGSSAIRAANLQLRLNPEIDILSSTIAFAADDLTIERLGFVMAGYEVSLTGGASIATRGLQLSGTAHANVDPAVTGSVAAPASTDIRVSGTIDQPTVTIGANRAGPRQPPAPGPHLTRSLVPAPGAD